MVYSKIKEANLFILTQSISSMRIIKSYLLNKMEGRIGEMKYALKKENIANPSKRRN